MYDLSFLEEIGDKQYLLDMLTLVVNNTRLQFELMQKGLLDQDWDLVINNAHKAKGSIGMLQVAELMSLLVKIETAGKETFTRHELPELIEKAILLYSQMETLLNKDIERLKSELSAG